MVYLLNRLLQVVLPSSFHTRRLCVDLGSFVASRDMYRDKLKLTQSHLCIIWLLLECSVLVSSLCRKQIFVRVFMVLKTSVLLLLEHFIICLLKKMADYWHNPSSCPSPRPRRSQLGLFLSLLFICLFSTYQNLQMLDLQLFPSLSLSLSLFRRIFRLILMCLFSFPFSAHALSNVFLIFFLTHSQQSLCARSSFSSRITLYVWSSNFKPGLGDNDKSSKIAPQKVDLLDNKDIVHVVNQTLLILRCLKEDIIHVKKY